MKIKLTKLKLLLTALFVVGFAGLAFADGYDLTFKSIKELPVTTAAPTSSDLAVRYVAADNKVEAYSATTGKISGAFNGTVGATTPSTGAFTVLSASTGVDGILGGVTPAAATVTTLTSTTHNGVTINAGASGTAGTFNVFPTTAANGKLIVSAINNSGAFNSTITNSNIGQSTVYSLPDAGAATAIFVTDAGTQTISGTKTMTAPVLNNPVVSGPAPVACGSTCTLGASAKGTYVRLDTAGGSAATLPSATGTGTTYKMYISVATTSAQDKVLLTTVTDTIIGTATGENAGTAKVFVGNAGTYHSIQMPNAGSQPSGGFIGDTITCTDVASTIWKCDIQYQAGTTPTTPYNAGTT